MSEHAELEELRIRRLGYVQAARANGFEKGLRSLLSELYPDNAHFIYELLQNAEDAHATTIEFALHEDHLKVSHDGKRLFTLQDIDSITGIGQSTKKDDPTQIGKFGVGFKAVFAYTSQPRVWSGPYSFAITDLFVPEQIPGSAPPGMTTFAFPFDRPDKPAKQAREEIERGLQELDEKTLLFLNDISTITYELPDRTIGIIERTAIDDRHIRIQKSEGESFVESHWLRLVGPTSEGHERLRVAAAFRLEQTNVSRGEGVQGAEDGSARSSGHQWSVSALKSGEVSIYFPAAREVSGLRFHIHAPFASTVARDSVRDDPGNIRLVSGIGALIVDELPRLCADGLVDDRFLAAMPNGEDSIAHPYTLIRNMIAEAFNDLPITPVRGSSQEFAAARTLVSSPSDFRNGLEPTDLPPLFNLAQMPTEPTPRWIRDRDGRAGKFLSSLETMEFGWRELNSILGLVREIGNSQQPRINEWLRWLEAKSDGALLDFYQLIGRGSKNSALLRADLKGVPMIRLVQRGKRKHVRGPQTYLPASRADTVQTRVPIGLAYFDDDEDQARAHYLKLFYTAAGVKRWDLNAKLEQRLERYPRSTFVTRAHPPADHDPGHLSDVREFVRYGLRNQRLAREKFGDVPFLLAEQSDGSLRWATPQETFLDLPFRETGLSSLYPRTELFWQDTGGYAYDEGPYPLSAIYLEVDKIEEFLELAGAKTRIEICPVDVYDNPLLSWSWRTSNNENSYGERYDWGIADLDKILESQDHILLRQLWDTVARAPASKAIASYQANKSAPKHPMASQLAQALKTTAWILDRNGDVKLPCDMTIDDLPEDCVRPVNASLVHRLDFGAEAHRRREKLEGVSNFLREEGLDEDGIEVLREARDLGFTIEQMRAFLRQHAEPLGFPEAASIDPDRRSSVAAADAETAPLRTTALRERSVVVAQSQASSESRAYLRGHYTRPTGEMHCQACRKVLPFRTSDGLWYFEAVRLVSGRKQIHTANAIALCPLCAAMFKYTRQTKEDELMDVIATVSVSPGQGLVEVPVILDHRRVAIAFTGKHAIDLKAALGIAGDRRDTA
ncbi:sacsin N-terminal ATP-binding-like domain-containing protein [Tessaracoccus oleiagri]|uniref:Sacsin/Nov domain-containing protein n=1 Tax=Tessaracoccus oleiagri TaxID=686624 RepID=A0A1G9K1W6_9ACTN|nr:hypothetical protein [Tessaracoccus oleiagri]SDL43761.1 hypothetical protein SAMN04488242_1597 [Tessaracoccus oleiagri]